ncbi:hypothetical protein [Parabacteroides gordonii]|nr:hypothetical protein [Parabacteroides gordonii]MCA5585003.1 hypothetical protein [Parabacteroides gordonii]
MIVTSFPAATFITAFFVPFISWPGVALDGYVPANVYVPSLSIVTPSEFSGNDKSIVSPSPQANTGRRNKSNVVKIKFLCIIVMYLLIINYDLLSLL